jgi:hypothetical protein
MLQMTLQTLDGNEFCSKIPDITRKTLTLKIASCQMEDFNLSMFRGNETLICQETLSESNVMFCLGHLSQMGRACYLSSFSYVETLCIRIAQNRTIRINNETQYDFVTRIKSLMDLYWKLHVRMDVILSKSTALLDQVTMYPQKVVQLLLNSSMIVKGDVKQAVNENVHKTGSTYDNKFETNWNRIKTLYVQFESFFFMSKYTFGGLYSFFSGPATLT